MPGASGPQLVRAMLICPNGHHNPADQQLCQVCDALIVPTSAENARSARRRSVLVFTVVGALLLAVVVAGAVFLGLKNGSGRDTPRPPDDVDSAAVRQWWSTAREHFNDLKDAVDVTNGAVEEQLDPKLIEDSCQQMHDAADVKLQAHLPSPDQDLTAELAAAIQDFHAAAHMCLSVIAGSMNSYGGEFESDLQQGEKHLDAALAIIDKSQPQI